MLLPVQRHHWFAAQGLGTPACSRGVANFRKQPRYILHVPISSGVERTLPDRILCRRPSQDTAHAHVHRAAAGASPRYVAQDYMFGAICPINELQAAFDTVVDRMLRQATCAKWHQVGPQAPTLCCQEGPLAAKSAWVNTSHIEE